MIKKLKRATQFCLKFQKSFVKRVTRGRRISGIINRRTNQRSHRDWNARFSNLDVPPRRWDWFKVVPFENSLTFEGRSIVTAISGAGIGLERGVACFVEATNWQIGPISLRYNLDRQCSPLIFSFFPFFCFPDISLYLSFPNNGYV